MASLGSNGRRRRRAAAAGTVAFAVCASVLAGCGGSSGAPGKGDAAEGTEGTAAVALPADQPQRAACGLVTQAEVEAAIGAKVGPGREDAQPGRSGCGFPLASAADQSVVVVSTTSSGVPAAFKAARDRARSPQSVTTGEEAFVSGPQALVRKGNTMVAILIVVRQPPAQAASAATKLAQAVGARL